jgi:hypothetical protein
VGPCPAPEYPVQRLPLALAGATTTIQNDSGPSLRLSGHSVASCGGPTPGREGRSPRYRSFLLGNSLLDLKCRMMPLA